MGFIVKLSSVSIGSIMDIKIKRGEWVLVLDGQKALLMRNEGDELLPQLATVRALERRANMTRTYVSDARGRVRHRYGVESAFEQTDWHDQIEQQFIQSIISYVESLVELRLIQRLLFIAPPRALVFLRAHRSAKLKEATIGELARDLVALPVCDIERALTT